MSKYTSKTGKNSSSVTAVTYNYTYDVNGNITQITDASGVIQNKYYYDDLGQLTREDNKAKNYSYTYEYDNAGNITAKKRYAFTTGSLGSVQYTYDYTYSTSSWGDLLVNYGSDKIEYDAISNPTKIGYYYDEYSRWGSGAELKWQGRQLMSYSMFEDYPNSSMFYTRIYSYKYNADGIRTSKNINGVEHRYTLSGSQIVSETWTENGTEYLMIYLYDDTGAPLGIKNRTSAYAADVFDYFFFEKNLQGDIAAIYNANGVKIGSYAYDAWGVCAYTAANGATTLEKSILISYNPFRYRGYYYDTETGLYYLQSRYYNPNWGRFISADEVIAGNVGSLYGYNLFAYCFNDPINLVDDFGQWPKWMEDAGKWLNNKVIKPGVKKVGNYVHKSMKSTWNAIDAKVYFGEGFGTDMLGITKPVVVGLNDGKEYTGYEVNYNGLFFSKNYLHLSEYDFESVRCEGKHSTEPRTIKNIKECYATTYSSSIIVGPFSVNSDNDLSIGVSTSIFVGIGFGVSFRFSISEFLEGMLQ